MSVASSDVAHARSAHTCRCTPLIPGSSASQRSVGRCEVTVDVDKGAIWRGGAGVQSGPLGTLPAVHVTLHTPATHVESRAPMPTGHGVQSVPHVALLALEAHTPPHT